MRRSIGSTIFDTFGVLVASIVVGAFVGGAIGWMLSYITNAPMHPMLAFLGAFLGAPVAFIGTLIAWTLHVTSRSYRRELKNNDGAPAGRARRAS